MNVDTPAKKILILAANPKQTSRLRLDEEVRDIKEGLRLSQQRDKFILQQEWAVRPRDVRRAVLDFRPNIIHFSGHGSGSTGLSFEDETGKEKLVTSEALAGLFGQFAKQVECVVLNACYSEEQALAIAQHIDYVIGMNAAIGDKAALEFAVGFYDALVAYDPRYDTYSRIEFAFNIACNAIQFAGVPGDSIPIMKKKPHLGKVEEQPANLVEESQSSNNTVPANQKQVSENYAPQNQTQRFDAYRQVPEELARDGVISPKSFVSQKIQSERANSTTNSPEDPQNRSGHKIKFIAIALATLFSGFIGIGVVVNRDIQSKNEDIAQVFTTSELELLNNYEIRIYILTKRSYLAEDVKAIQQDFKKYGFKGNLQILEKDESFFKQLNYPNVNPIAYEIRYDPGEEEERATILQKKLTKLYPTKNFRKLPIGSGTKNSISLFLGA